MKKNNGSCQFFPHLYNYIHVGNPVPGSFSRPDLFGWERRSQRSLTWERNSANWLQNGASRCEGETSPFVKEEVERYLISLAGWEYIDASIVKLFEFKNYYRTMAFVNAVAWIAHSEDHHPKLEVSYRSCRVCYSTHAIGGLSENDFICAAKVDTLIPV